MNNKERSEESDVLKLLLINIYLIFFYACVQISLRKSLSSKAHCLKMLPLLPISSSMKR